ncbi:MAG: ROK family protein [Ruminococcaceae bacterium]|nr:ROK family protein [Oscillospiraceae bacterium]
MFMSYIGIDIGGTKCAVVRGKGTDIEHKVKFETTTCAETLAHIFAEVGMAMTDDVTAIGVSCGGPLDSAKGIIKSPPNLPGWDNIHITEALTAAFNVPAYLCNDADACALAEWQYGAGKGAKNLAFLTFGTGLGAGLILGGRLHTGACGMAGELGHVTLHRGGDHIGYNKRGSVEGYCSGAGIAQYGKGTAKELGIRAEAGDAEAIAVYEQVGDDLGRALAILVDLLNLDTIVIGSIYARSKEFIEPAMRRALAEEALEASVAAVEIYPAALSEHIGDIAALCVAELGGKGYAV